MSTALSDQLASVSLAWRARTGGAARAPGGGPRARPSLLYDAATAADVDVATVYEVGLSGKRKGRKRERGPGSGDNCAGPSSVGPERRLPLPPPPARLSPPLPPTLKQHGTCYP
jgi:hypothetical protein